MKKLVPFSKIAKNPSVLAKTSVIVEENGIPTGFVFGRDAFISFLEYLDTEFEKRANNEKKAYGNPAGNLIDLIEEKLPINPKFAKELKASITQAKKTGWIPFEQIVKTLNV